MENFFYKKQYGQNFLYDENIINKIVNESGVDEDTLVIEIGPGSGNLSKKLIPLAGFSILYEIDTSLSNLLSNKLEKYDNYKIIFGDFLKQDIISDIKNYMSEFKKLYVVANLPYYITTPIIEKLLNTIYPDRILIMVQDEVADRLSAKINTRNYGMISVLLGAFYDIEKLFKVSCNSFYPKPGVESAVISMNKLTKYSIKDKDLFISFIQDAFKFKRKNLKNNLIKYDLDRINEVLIKYNLNLNSRAENVPVGVFVEIVNNLV